MGGAAVLFGERQRLEKGALEGAVEDGRVLLGAEGKHQRAVAIAVHRDERIRDAEQAGLEARHVLGGDGAGHQVQMLELAQLGQANPQRREAVHRMRTVQRSGAAQSGFLLAQGADAPDAAQAGFAERDIVAQVQVVGYGHGLRLEIELGEEIEQASLLLSVLVGAARPLGAAAGGPLAQGLVFGEVQRTKAGDGHGDGLDLLVIDKDVDLGHLGCKQRSLHLAA